MSPKDKNARPAASAREPRTGKAAPAKVTSRWAIDCLAMGALLIIALLTMEPVWGSAGLLIPAAGGVVTGLGVAVLAAWRRWGVLTIAAATIVAFLAVAGPLALAPTTIAGFIPTGNTLFAAATGLVVTWKQYLTAAIPLAAFDGMGLVPLVIGLVGAVAAGSLALRARQPAWALVPVGIAAAGSILFGAPRAAWPLAQAIAFLIIAFAYLAWRAAHDAKAGAAGLKTSHTRTRWGRLAAGGALLALAALVTATAASAVPSSQHREVLRDYVVPPLDLRNYHSPLAGFRAYHKELEKTTLFHVTGLPARQRLTLATMDVYDGLVYNVAGTTETSSSGTFAHVGSELDAAQARGEATLAITVKDETGVWMPGGGRPVKVTFTGPRAGQLADGLYFNSQDGQLLTTAVLEKGDGYRLATSFTTPPSPSQLAGVNLAKAGQPANAGIPDAADTMANKLAGDAADPIGQVLNLTEGLSKQGFFSHGLEGEAPSLPGHNSPRIAALLGAKQMVGDDEQYAVAAALMARQLGIPARVVLGFYPEDGTDVSKGWDVTGNDAHAWIEVPFAGYGWVPFDATPPKDQVPQTQVPETKNEPKPQVLQPPPPPEEPAEVPPETVQDAPRNQKDKLSDQLWAKVLIGAGAVAGGLAIATIPLWLIAGLKALRTRRRRSEGDYARRIAGGFTELCDQARDFGGALPGKLTRPETGRVIAAAYPDTHALALAVRADKAVFGPFEPERDEAESYWRDVDDSVTALRHSRNRWGRIKARISLASLRRRDQRRES